MQLVTPIVFSNAKENNDKMIMKESNGLTLPTIHANVLQLGQGEKRYRNYKQRKANKQCFFFTRKLTVFCTRSSLCSHHLYELCKGRRKHHELLKQQDPSNLINALFEFQLASTLPPQNPFQKVRFTISQLVLSATKYLGGRK